MSQIQVIQPDSNGAFPSVVLTVTDSKCGVVFDLGGKYDKFSLQMVKDGSADLTSLVHKVQISQDGANPVDFTSPVTLNAAGFIATQTVTAIRYVHSTFTTAGTSGNVRLFARAAKQITP